MSMSQSTFNQLMVAVIAGIITAVIVERMNKKPAPEFDPWA